MTRTQRLPQAQRRDQVVSVATEVFARTGYRTASMDAVALAAGVSKPVLYQHFDSKQSLYLAVIDAASVVFDTVVTAALHSTEDNEERVIATFNAYFSFVSEHRHEFLILVRADPYEPEAAKKADSARERAAERVTEVIAANTTTAPAEAALLAAAITGLAESAALQFLDRPDLNATTTTRLMTGLLWRGISSFPNPGKPAGDETALQ